MSQTPNDYARVQGVVNNNMRNNTLHSPILVWGFREVVKLAASEGAALASDRYLPSRNRANPTDSQTPSLCFPRR